MAWLSGWNYRKKITVQNANIDTSDLTWFPLYVDITADTDIGGNVSDTTNGYDIRFTQSDGTTLLKYEREYFNVTTGTATGHYWVSADGWVLANASTTDLYIYYNDGDGTVDGEDASAVWDSNFVAIYHLNTNLNDSTGTTGNLTASGCSADTSGKIAGCYDFTGGDGDYASIDVAAVSVAPFTFEAWIYSTDTNLTQCAVFVGDKDVTDNWWALLADGVTAGDPISLIAVDTSNAQANTTASFSTSTWYYAVGIETTNVSRAARINTGNEGTDTTDLSPDNADRTAIGQAMDSSASKPFYGKIDEVRISNKVRGDNWLKFTYHNITEADNELDWAAEEIATTFIPQVIIIG